MNAGTEGMAMNHWLRVVFSGAAIAAAASAQSTQATGEAFEVTEDNLLVVLRETPGANKPHEDLQPFGLISARLPDGREVHFEASWFQYLGDMHLRLVFDGDDRVQSAAPEDLDRLRLTPEEAIERAIDNLRRRYGEPVAAPWDGGLIQVIGNSPDVASSYFLDRRFWLEQARLHPEGIVAAVPRRSGLVFTPADNAAALLNLQFTATVLYTEGERNRVSSGLYLFKDGRWSVYQPPLGTVSASAAASADDDDD
jgi:hypothetical protein